MTLIVTDASVWVSRLATEDAFHPRVKTWMTAQRAVLNEFLAPSLLLAEIGAAISRRTANPHLGQLAVAQINVLPGLRLVEMDRMLAETAAALAA